MKKKKERVLPSTNKIFLSIIMIATFFIGIGYAAINSVTFNIEGDVIAAVQDGIFITDVKYEDGSEDLSFIINGTTLDSSISLEEELCTSEVSIVVTLYNSSKFDYLLSDVVYASEIANEINEIYSNSNIKYTFKSETDVIRAGGYLDVTLTFSFIETADCTQNYLDFILNFEFILPEALYTYDYIGDIQSLTVPYSGMYTIEVWGAQGGNVEGQTDHTLVDNSDLSDGVDLYLKYTGGKGGYSKGLVYLKEGTELFVAVGGSGTGNCIVSPCKGGYNGGGTSGVSLEDDWNYTSSGGGATHVALSNLGELYNYENNKSDVIIVAGGGGGSYFHVFGTKYCSDGGAGGGLNGLSGIQSEYSESVSGLIVTPATGGTQTSAGTGGYRGANGSFGKGGTGASCETIACGSSGGGGGWYGGGAAGHSGSGGGSGYISSLAEGTSYDGVQTIPSHDGTTTMIGNSGNGYAKIKLN